MPNSALLDKFFSELEQEISNQVSVTEAEGLYDILYDLRENFNEKFEYLIEDILSNKIESLNEEDEDNNDNTNSYYFISADYDIDYVIHKYEDEDENEIEVKITPDSIYIDGSEVDLTEDEMDTLKGCIEDDESTMIDFIYDILDKYN